MQFKNPELLYALFALLIPLLVHLFQLRKFKKVAFTNVAFLKKVKLQTRKSNTIKKWLLLATRMLALAALILAFAQPYSTASNSATKEKETVIYLDNSFSMQAKGKNGELLKQSIQDLITKIPEDQNFTLFTNTETFTNITTKDSRNDLLNIAYAANQLLPTAINLKAQKAFSADESTVKRFVYISDFQTQKDQVFKPVDRLETFAIQAQPERTNNIYIDSMYANKNAANTIELAVIVKSNSIQAETIPVSVFNGEELIAKATADLSETTAATLLFDVPATGNIRGKIALQDPLVRFDNTLFFSLNTTTAIKVLAINEANSAYLRKIFTAPEFNLTGVDAKSLNYSLIPEQNIVILNELTVINPALVNALEAFQKNGGSVVIIPSLNPDVSSYALASKTLMGIDVVRFRESVSKTPQLITSISYDHPLYVNVFDRRIDNFQYPSISSTLELKGGNSVLKMADGSSFLVERGGSYMFAGALNTQNSNFKNAPLIVPTFYNMGRQSLAIPPLYFNINSEVSFDVPANVADDAVVQLQSVANNAISFITLQQQFKAKVRVTTLDQPENAGNYTVTYKDEALQEVSYNYNRNESILRYQTLESDANLTYYNTVEALFDDLQSLDEVKSLWKWFIIFALLFLCIEVLILKFIK